MKFSCDRCHTRYSIPDERVKGKVLKIRCKTCGNVITVGGRKKRELKTTDSSPSRRARAVRPKASAVGLPAAGQPAASRKGTSHKTGSAIPEIKSAAARAQGKRTGKATRPALAANLAPEEPDFADKTVVSDPNIDMDALKAELAAGPPTVSDISRAPHRMEPESLPGELEEWYLADDHGEYGPMTFSELAARIRRREHGPDAQVWREGFPDWMDLEAVPELRPHLKHVPPPRVRHKEDWAEPEPAVAPVKLTEPPPELAPKPEPEPEPIPARSQPRSVVRPIPAGAARPATEAVAGPPKRGAGPTDAFFGKETLEPESQDHISAPVAAVGMAEVAAPVLVPTTAPSADKNKLFAVLFAIMGGVALIALTALVFYLFFHDRNQGASGKRTAVAQNQTKSAMAPPLTQPRPTPQPRPTQDMAPPQQGEGDEELIMDPVELKLPPRQARTGGAARPRTASSATARPRSTARAAGGLGSSFSTGSFGSFGPVGIRDRKGPAPRVESSRPRPVHATRKVTKPEVMAVIRRHVHRLKRCYERAVRLHPTELRRAKMKVSIRVSSSGRVTRVSITPGRYRGLSLGDCIVSTIRSWKFPPSTQSYGTGFPLSFVGK